MRKSIFIFLAASIFCSVQAQEPVKHSLKTESDSVSYALGITIGSEYVQPLKNFPGEINKDLLIAGFIKGLKEDTANYQINQSETESLLQNYFKKIAQEEMEKVELENNKILEENKNKKGVKVTDTGLQYKIITKGKGKIPAKDDIVKVHYVGRLADGTLFDSTVDRGEPAEFSVNALIPGFSEALKMMPAGSKWELTIPSGLGYGTEPVGNIPANSVLIFEVELLEIVPNKVNNDINEEKNIYE